MAAAGHTPHTAAAEAVGTVAAADTDPGVAVVVVVGSPDHNSVSRSSTAAAGAADWAAAAHSNLLHPGFQAEKGPKAAADAGAATKVGEGEEGEEMERIVVEARRG